MRLFPAIALALVLAAGAAPAGDQEDANRIFVAAMQDWAVATAGPATSAEEVASRIARLEGVAAALERIVRDHPGSDLAVKIVTGQAVGPLSTASVAEALAKLRAGACAAQPDVACVLEAALAVVRGEKERWRVPRLAEIATVLADAGETARAQALIDEALAIALAEPDPKERSYGVLFLALDENPPGRFGLIDRALPHVESAATRASLHLKVAQERLEAGETAAADAALERAIAEARKDGPPAGRVSALVNIAEVLITAKRQQEAQALLDEALTLAQAVGDAESRSRAFAGILRALGKGGLADRIPAALDGALDAIAALTAPEKRTAQLRSLAETAANAGERDTARLLLGEAKEGVARVALEATRHNLMRSLAEAEARIVGIDAALAYARTIPPKARDEALAAVAREMVRAEQFDAAATLIATLPEGRPRQNAYDNLASALARAGDAEAARKSAEKSGDAAAVAGNMAQIAAILTYWKDGKPADPARLAEARTTLTLARRLLTALPAADAKKADGARLWLADAEALLGDPGAGFRTAGTIVSPVLRVSALMRIAQSLLPRPPRP